MILISLTNRIRQLCNPIIWSLYHEYLTHYLSCTHCIRNRSYILKKSPSAYTELNRLKNKYNYHREECRKVFTRAKLYITPDIATEWSKVDDTLALNLKVNYL